MDGENGRVEVPNDAGVHGPAHAREQAAAEVVQHRTEHAAQVLRPRQLARRAQLERAQRLLGD